MNQPNKNIEILLIEDNPDDVLLTKLAIDEISLESNIHVETDGIKAAKYLTKLTKENKQLPNLILLDINLPKINGLEILKKLKADNKIRYIPTIIFTSSNADTDINYAYKNGAELFIRKPNNISDYKNIMSHIVERCL